MAWAHDIDKLKKIISKAVAQGYMRKFKRASCSFNQNVLEEMHHGIIDFFELMDTLLNDAINNM